MLRKLNSLWLLILFISFIPSVIAQKVETQEADNAAIYLNQGLESYQQGKYGEAVLPFKKAIQLNGGFIKAARNPEWREVVIKLGIAESISGNHDGAMITFSSLIMNLQGNDAKQIILLDTENAQLYYDLGTAYYVSHGVPGLQDFSMKTAIALFRKAIVLKPDFAEAYEYLGYSFDAQHKYEAAVDAYKEAIRLKPESAESYNGLGLAYRSLNNYADAIEAFKKSISINPDFVAPYEHLGMTYIDIGNRALAMEQYRILMKLSPKSAEELRFYWKN